MRVPLLGGTYQAKSIIANAQRCVNLYPELNPANSQPQSTVTHYQTPGLVEIGHILPRPGPSPTATGLWITGVSCDFSMFLLADAGNVAPHINIQGSNTGLTGPIGDSDSITYAIDLDENLNQFVLAYYGGADTPGNKEYSILKFEPGSNGNVAFVSRIIGDNTGLPTDVGPDLAGMCLDGDSNIYVSIYGTVYKFPAGSTGNVPSSVVFVNGDFENISSLFYDAVNDWIWLSAFDLSGKGFIGAYDTTWLPKRLITMADSTGYEFRPTQVTRDVLGNIVCSSATSGSGVFVFAPDADGPSIPNRVITGGNTQMHNPVALAVDSAQIIYVGEIGVSPHRILKFNPGTVGNAVPDAVISGSLTGLDHLLNGVGTGPQSMRIK